MINLKKQSGLPIAFDTDAIKFGNDIISEPVHARSLEEARPYLMEADVTARRKNLYLMYRDVHNKRDEVLFRKHGIRYDITVLFPGTLGGKNGEYIKTIGHTHPAMEIYEVLHGDALFCLQTIGNKQNDVFYINATKGQKVLIPTGIGHVTINIGDEPLILADLFSDTVKSDYSLFKKRHGAAYWVRPPALSLPNGPELATEGTRPEHAEGLTLTKNKKHTDIGEVLIGTPEKLDSIGINAKTPIYTQFIGDPKLFNFLTDPKKEAQMLKKVPLFTIHWKGKLA